ncbi:MAG: hypothetical protein A2W71_00465 [Candidatus Nealsonbacteria bacterium RIFCSPLOWO2_02_39_8]|nr:MAG: hypothetical protein A2W71_00465 [Candidatus Nealsonbacteria bacterium RIFCSPLOWO2_02_39_8]
MPQEIYKLAIRDFANLLGTTIDDISENCKSLINKFDFRYRKLNSSERDAVILKVIKKIDSGELSFSGKERESSWETGWSENFNNFIKSDCDIAELVPKYIKKDQSIRFSGDYIMPLDANFEVNWYTIFRTWLFEKYFKGASAIYEFACGSGYNLPILAKLYPEKELHGLDWSPASKDIVNKLAEQYRLNMTGHLFNMFSPDEKLILRDNSAVLTMGGFEQLGENYKTFLSYLVGKSPLICAHMEPLVELYNHDILIDYLGMKFHKKRGYLGNFLTSLKKMESENKIKIIKIKKTTMGNLFHDGYCFVVWESNKTK